jgi:phosphodiesterase/alkaline phosphatase D-like protein
MSTDIFAGPWLGALTDTSVVVKATVFRGVSSVRAVVATDAGFTQNVTTHTGDVRWFDPTGKFRNYVVAASIEGLHPATRYHYALEIDGERQDERAGEFTTLPRAGEKGEFSIAFGSCSGNDTFLNFGFPHSEAFLAIDRERSARNLALFLHLGDLHYGNIDEETISKRIARYEWFLELREHGTLFRNLPFVYTWDDHDFLGNNSFGGDLENRGAARTALEAYDVFVPHHHFVNRQAGIFHAFTVGAVRFLITDARFNRTSKEVPGFGKTILGRPQREWLLSQLAAAKDYDLVVWANAIPWIAKADTGADNWGGYDHERRQIADFVEQQRITNLCMLSGDAHMLAIDDGSNNVFSSSGAKGFPVFHAGALDSMPSRKGGPYSHGKEGKTSGNGINGKRQFGVMDVSYDVTQGVPAGKPRVTWIGFRAEKGGDGEAEELVSFQFVPR